jgi:hypothetical protein
MKRRLNNMTSATVRELGATTLRNASGGGDYTVENTRKLSQQTTTYVFIGSWLGTGGGGM